jgi:hypothetical protein
MIADDSKEKSNKSSENLLKKSSDIHSNLKR